eukprot:gene10974-3681_t
METELLQAYIALLVMALIPIVIGSYRSLKSKSTETLSSSDAYYFPIIASCVLFGLYLVFKFLAKDLINLLLTSYYVFLGVGAISAFLKPFFKAITPSSIGESKPFQFKFSIPLMKEPFEIDLDYLDILGGIIGSIVGFVYFYFDKNWIANNIFGEAFSVISIELLSLGSFKIAFILLWGLFFYDIFWVFGTDVMETVAKSFEGPIKVIWPRGEGKFSLLGLGDIVIPGFFIAMMLRFDRHLAEKHKRPNNQIYFKVCFLSYVCALITTVYVLHTFKHGQPALLYIVPFIIISVVVLSLLRGEFNELISYSEETEEKVTENANSDVTVATEEDKKDQ